MDPVKTNDKMKQQILIIHHLLIQWAGRKGKGEMGMGGQRWIAHTLHLVFFFLKYQQ